jgi:hypothetical protein
MIITTLLLPLGHIPFKFAAGAGGTIGVQIKSLLFMLVKSHNLVFSGVAILAKLKADK